MEAGRVILIRHARAAGQEPDAPLLAEGRGQAAALADRLTALGVDRMFSSPFRRALDTVAPFATRLGAPVVVLGDLRERLLAPVSPPEWETALARSFVEPDFRLPGGESQREALGRGLRAIVTAAASGAMRPAAVSHGNLIAAVLSSLDAGFGFAGWQGMRNPDLFELDLVRGRPVRFRRLAPGEAGLPAAGPSG